MKACLFMFCFLILALLLAVFTDSEQNSHFEQRLLISEEITENLVKDDRRRDSIRHHLDNFGAIEKVKK